MDCQRSYHVSSPQISVDRLAGPEAGQRMSALFLSPARIERPQWMHTVGILSCHPIPQPETTSRGTP